MTSSSLNPVLIIGYAECFKNSGHAEARQSKPFGSVHALESPGLLRPLPTTSSLRRSGNTIAFSIGVLEVLARSVLFAQTIDSFMYRRLHGAHMVYFLRRPLPARVDFPAPPLPDITALSLLQFTPPKIRNTRPQCQLAAHSSISTTTIAIAYDRYPKTPRPYSLHEPNCQRPLHQQRHPTASDSGPHPRHTPYLIPELRKLGRSKPASALNCAPARLHRVHEPMHHAP